jgi:hypothetical protein
MSITTRTTTSTIMIALGAAGMVLAGLATPANASFNHTRILEMRGGYTVVTHDVGNQTFPLQFVAGDVRRHEADTDVLHYRIDLTELPTGFTPDEVEVAIESAVATFNAVPCSKTHLVRVDADPGADLGFAQHLTGLGGSEEPLPDITFAGWVPTVFFQQIGQFPANGVTFPIVFDGDESSLVPGYDVLAAAGDYSDVDRDGNADTYAMEVYFNSDSTFTTDPVAGDSLFAIDLESIALHELGHALGMDHFGRTEIILDENFEFVDIEVNPNSVSLMNTNNYLTTRELSGSDVASFCGIYANWGTPGRGH